MNIVRIVRLLVLSIGVLAVLLISKYANAEGWPTNFQHFTDIRTMVQGLADGTHLMFTLNDGTQVFGEFLKYERYNDWVWYQPQNTGRSWLAQDALDVHEIFRIDIITQEPI